MYCGRVKSYNPKQGYGFLDCPDAKNCFGRDVFIHKAQMGELLGRFVGPGTKLDPKTLKMNVRFGVEINKSGMPQARDVSRLELLEGHGLEPEQEEVDVALLLPRAATAMAPPTSPELSPSEAWDDDAARRGYKGRGGTIRILPDSEGSADGSPMLVALPITTTTSRGSGGNGPRKNGRTAKRGGTGTKTNAPLENWFIGDGLNLDVHNENWERLEDDLARRVRRPSKQNASVPTTVDNKRRGHKDSYLQQAPLQQQQQQQFTHAPVYDSRTNVAYFQATNDQAAHSFGQVQSPQTQSPPLSPMGGSTVSPYTSAVSPVFNMQEAPPTYAASYQLPSMMSFPSHMTQVYGTTVQPYQGDTSQPMHQYLQYQGQHQVYGQLQAVQQAVPLSPQSSSHYAPSSPTHSPLPVSATDGSGSPISLSLPPAVSGMLVTSNPQELGVLLSMAGGVDQGLHMMHSEGNNMGSPLNHYISDPDSDSDAGFSPLPPLSQGIEAFPGTCGVWTD